MKKLILPAVSCFCLGLSGCSGKTTGAAVIIVLGILLMLFSGLRTMNMVKYNKRKRRRKPIPPDHILATGLLFLIALLLVFIGILMTIPVATAPQKEAPTQSGGQSTGSSEPGEVTVPDVLFTPAADSGSDPKNWSIQWEIFKNGNQVGSFDRADPIYFGDPEEYFALPGISTFRGNNYRNSTTYGTANVESEQIENIWKKQTSTLSGSSWSGSGWTGQPLIVQWPEQTKKLMNLYPDAKSKEGLVEVIYATLDGHIYFMDLENGMETRDPINVGMCFKGAGSLDPRGYPLMYVGSGDETNGKRPRMYIISLIDGSILFEYGHEEGDLTFRTDNNNWCAFDSAPLIHGETDTLIWPGESGILYTMKLNTAYENGTISVNPDNMVVTRYRTQRSGSYKYWYGYEASAVIVQNYLYISENGGMFFCIDLNTMGLVWAQDTVDDSNCTPVFEWISDEEAYIYTAPSLHWTRSDTMQGTIRLYKLNALTGEIIWEKPYNVHTIDGVSGGVQSTPLLGKPGTALEGLVIFTVARTPNVYTGVMVALDTQTGEEVWTLPMNNYAWSSPVAVYESDGNGYVIVCDSGGYMMLVNAEGQLLYTIGLGGNIEATPAVYEDTIVVGTRAEAICGVKIK